MDTLRVRCLYLQLDISRSQLHWRYIWEFLVFIWYLRGFQVALVVKNLCANAGDVRDAVSTPGSRRSARGGNSNPL